MAVTTEKSTQATNQEANNAHLETREVQGRLRIAYFDFTQGAAAGDATSTVDLIYIPAGRVRVMSKMCWVTCSAFGASRVLDVGHTGYTDEGGTAVTADPDMMADGLDVSAAADIQMGLTTSTGVAAATGMTHLFTSRDRTLIQAVVAGGTIPAAATLNGFLVYVND